MISNNQLSMLIQPILNALSMPAKVVLFGSYARGDADEGSDIDLLVLAHEFSDKANVYLALKSAIGRVGIGVDLVLMTLSEFERRAQVPGTLPYWASKEGKVCYDSLS
jgi:predicted nucleotidyltransferase